MAALLNPLENNEVKPDEADGTGAASGFLMNELRATLLLPSDPQDIFRLKQLATDAVIDLTSMASARKIFRRRTMPSPLKTK